MNACVSQCKRLLTTLWDSFDRLIYPADCLHCHISLPPNAPCFCEECASLLTLIDPLERCRACFEPLPPEQSCKHCQEFPLYYHRVGAAFEYEGPAAVLIKQLKYAKKTHLARGAAAYMLAQWDQLEWPVPDLIVPVPQSFWRRWVERGFNQSELLARELGGYLNVPVKNALKRRHGSLRQASLNLEQRRKLDEGVFYLNSAIDLRDKTILVIDDVLTSGATLRQCAVALSGGFPAKLYALTLCRT